MKKFWLAFSVHSWLGISAAFPQADLVIAPDGNDGNPGSIEKPFASLERARDEVRRRIAAGLDRDLLVWLRGGRYRLDRPVRFGPEDSAGEKHSITYAAYPGEKPALSGGRRISGWERGPGAAWTAQVPRVQDGAWRFRQLFVNGERRTRARTPDSGFFRIEGPSSQDHPFNLRFKAGDIKKSWAGDGSPGSPGDVEVIALLSWAEIRMLIRSVDEAARIAVLNGDPRPSNREDNARYYIENAPDGLDAPGEWRLDSGAGKLSYIPLPGEDMAAAEVVAPELDRLIFLEGDAAAGKTIRRLIFRGLSFHHTEWPTGPGGYADSQSANAIGGAFKAAGAIDCAVERCTFSQLGGYAIELAGGCRGNRIAGNDLADLGAGGIRIGEGSQTQIEAGKTTGNAITDNHLRSLGRVFHAGVGVWIGQASDNQVSFNHIHDLYYTAISAGWTWGYGPNQCRGNRIESNHLHHVGLGMLSDMGGIYTLGVQPGTVLRRNLIHDVQSFAYGGWGIYPDEGSSEILIEENIVYDCKSASFHQHYGRENIVRNNIFAFGKENQLMRSRQESHRSFTFERNLIIWTEGELLGSVWNDDQYLFSRNLYWKMGGGEIRFGKWSFEEWQKRGQDAGSRIADPRFTDPGKRDFTLLPGSPALQLGFQPIDATAVGPRRDPGTGR